MVTNGHAHTTVTDDGRLAWTIGDAPPQTNPIHHGDHDFLNQSDEADDEDDGLG
jgi:hypothetical protein